MLVYFLLFNWILTGLFFGISLYQIYRRDFPFARKFYYQVCGAGLLCLAFGGLTLNVTFNLLFSSLVFTSSLGLITVGSLLFIIAAGDNLIQNFHGRRGLNFIREFLFGEFRDQYESIFWQAPNSMLILDGIRIIECNSTAEEVFGCPREEIVSKTLVDFSQSFQSDGEKSGKKLRQKIARVREKGKKFFEWTHKRADGIPFSGEISLTSVGFGKREYIMAIIRDIHGRKKLEQELRVARNKLKKANERLEEQAIFDELTGILNRRGFERALSEEWNRCRRLQKPLSLLIIDIDFFKQYNDSYGHVEGDDCLKRIAGLLKENVRRAGDTASRYGGEEFAAILPATPMEGAKTVAENIRQAVKEAEIEHPSSPIADFVTVSVGAHTLIPGPDKEPGTLVKTADQALYRAKNAGRNRVEPA